MPCVPVNVLSRTVHGPDGRDADRDEAWISDPCEFSQVSNVEKSDRNANRSLFEDTTVQRCLTDLRARRLRERVRNGPVTYIWI